MDEYVVEAPWPQDDDKRSKCKSTVMTVVNNMDDSDHAAGATGVDPVVSNFDEYLSKFMTPKVEM